MGFLPQKNKTNKQTNSFTPEPGVVRSGILDLVNPLITYRISSVTQMWYDPVYTTEPL